MTQLLIAKIRTDGGTQMRCETDQAWVEDLVEALDAGCALPPVIVYRDAGGVYWLADGFHRLAAHILRRARYVEADVRAGELRDAVLFAVGTNRKHGLRRTNLDKRKCVLTLLADPEWGAWSNCQIANQCGVSEGLVRILRDELTSYNTSPPEEDSGPAGPDPAQALRKLHAAWETLRNRAARYGEQAAPILQLLEEVRVFLDQLAEVPPAAA